MVQEWDDIRVEWVVRGMGNGNIRVEGGKEWDDIRVEGGKEWEEIRVEGGTGMGRYKSRRW